MEDKDVREGEEENTIEDDEEVEVSGEGEKVVNIEDTEEPYYITLPEART